MNNKLIYIALFVSLLLIPTQRFNAQIKNSVYSLFGVGQLTDKSFGINKSLGGTGIAFQSGRSINYLNPASYLGIAPDSYIMELGLNGLLVKSKQGNISKLNKDIDFSYATASLYFTRWWAFSFGIVPYTTVDYEINSIDQIGGELTTFNKTFEGSGGLNKIYWGNSIEIIKGLSFGINTCYIFGHILQTETALADNNFPGYELTSNRFAGSVYFDYGLQYSLRNDDWFYTVGMIYGANKRFNTTDDLEFTADNITTTLSEENKADIKIPEKYGFGVSIKKGELFRAGVDYEWNKWSDISFSNASLDSRDSRRYSFGLEYSPSAGEEGKWLSTLFYRLGFNYKESYLELNGTKINSMAMNIGFGIPYDGTSMINLALEYGKEGTTSQGLIENNFLKVHLNISLHQFWETNNFRR